MPNAWCGRTLHQSWVCSTIEPALSRETGAQRQRRLIGEGASIEEVFAAEVAEAGRTYAAEEVRT